MGRGIAIWGGLAVAMIAPVLIATQSPLLAWRQPIYIVAGFAGIIGMALLLIQPLLARSLLPGLMPPQARRLHQALGITLAALVALHIIGLYITSPPDVIDVLLFRSPTPFGLWGAIAMWGVIGTATWAALRRPLKLRPQTWRRVHAGLAIVIVVATLAHALLIESTMGLWSKWGLAGLIALVTGWVIFRPQRRR